MLTKFTLDDVSNDAEECFEAFFLDGFLARCCEVYHGALNLDIDQIEGDEEAWSLQPLN